MSSQGAYEPVSAPLRGRSEVSLAISRDIDAVQSIRVIPTLLHIVCQQTGLGCAVVARVTKTLWTACEIEDSVGFGLQPGSPFEAVGTLCDEVRVRQRPLVIVDATADPVYRSHEKMAQFGVLSYVSVPIVLSDGSYFGNLCAFDRHSASFDESRTVSMMESFAQVIAMQLEGEDRERTTQSALLEERSTGLEREEFIAVLGHDLRNPLATISVSADILAAHPDPSLARIGARLARASDRMARMVEDLMDLARGRLGGGIRLDVCAGEDVAEALREIVEEHRVIHPDRELKAQIAIDAPVRCDRRRLQQMLSNLIGNAITHGADDQPVRVVAGLRDGALVLSVWNGGNAIDQAHRERIFEPYWRPANTRSEGLGLGLYICSQIVKAHRGSLDVASTAESGTVFVARFPI